MGSDELPLRTMVRVFRRECARVVGSERTTVRGADSMLLVLQLATAQVHKQEKGEFAAALSDVLAAWKGLLLDKLHLSHDTVPLPEGYELIRKEYERFLKRTNTVDLPDVHGMYSQLRRTTDPADPPTATQLFEFLRGRAQTFEEAEQACQCPATPSHRARLDSQMQRLVRRLFCSYLSLVVNTKDDLAVAHALNTPSRALGRAAFADLRHAAQLSHTSLFLAAMSFVRAIQLGGKGYAPPELDPLRKHLKGLSQFVHFTDQLEEILGETPEPSAAASRIVSSVRAALLKSLGNGHPVSPVVEKTANELKERIQQICTIQKESATSSGISPSRPRAYTINHATAYEGRETVKVLMALLDEEATAPPSRNSVELLTEDQDFLVGTEEMSLLMLFRSPEIPTGLSPKPLRKRVQGQHGHVNFKVKGRVIRSQFACTYLDDAPPLNRILEFPSTSQLPTCVHPAPRRQSPPPVPASQQEGRASTDTFHKLTVDVGLKPTSLAHWGSGNKAALVQRTGNAHTPTGGPGPHLASVQTVIKASKRKLANRESVEPGGEEIQPPQKRPASAACSLRTGNRKCKSAPRKLLAGQGTLTSFFRL
ncbi:hypothetical protein P4O66_014221 [Electrophorus voltai]|uniref:PCNA-interacting partner n=1 Tax=Electrophorus voltai TaxID=2609070 RepID=A0AAD8Z0E4_9TELE|nr:hypothetical protein P4O66_014221 [Electrophorus voltai]